MSFHTNDDDARADDEILAWAAPDDFASAFDADPARPDLALPFAAPTGDAYEGASYPAPADPGHGFAEPGEPVFEEPAFAEPVFEEGARDARYEPVGLNRRLVLGTALAFVALVLLGLMLVTGGNDEPQTASQGETREAATPEFIDRPPATDEAPGFAEPEPFGYEAPPDPYTPQPAGDPFAPAPAYGTGADYGAFDVPNNAPSGAPSMLSGTVGGAPQSAPRRAPAEDPREEGFLRARTSPLMVDGDAGSTGGRSAGAPRPATARRDDLGLSAAQRTAYDGLDPETQSAYREALQLSAAFGVDIGGAEDTGDAAPQREAPSARSGLLVAVPRGDAEDGAQDEEARTAPGAASRAAFLRRVQSAGSQEPFRVRTSGPSDRPAVRSSPASRRVPRGPAAGDDPDAVLPALSLLPGTVIPAVLVTGMNSELPGDVVAQVERDVFDSATLRHVLIPKGTRLVGTYDDQIAYGQNRALVAWTTMVFPDGRTVELPGLPGVDLQSAAGLQDRVDRHFGRVFGSAVALAAVGTGLALATPTRDGVDLSPQTIGAAQIAIELSRVATQVLRRELEVQPTVTIRPGYRLLVFLARAMEFDAPYAETPDPGRFRRFSREGTSGGQ